MDKTQLGAFIAERRKALGLTQKDLAARLHVTDKAVSKWERGLSYPDVTLLEPLAASLGLNLTELVSCTPHAETGEETREEQAMKDVLQLSADSVAATRKKGRRWIAVLAAVCLILAAMLTAFVSWSVTYAHRPFHVVWKETVADAHFLYVEDGDHLLRLACAPGVDYAAVDTGDPQTLYDMSIRYSRVTHRGTVETCQPSEQERLGSPMNEIGAVIGLDMQEHDALFGYFGVSVELVDRYPNPTGAGYLSTYTFWRTEKPDWRDHAENRILTISDCLGYTTATDSGGYAQADVDGDGITELLVRTKWSEKPCVVYGWEDGSLTETWLDTVPEPLKDASN